ncbi:hypothetical protein ADUPG1_003087, partial [Aduncisulcus paluster]
IMKSDVFESVKGAFGSKKEEEEEEEKEEGEKEAIKEIKSVNDLSKLELEIGRTFSIDLKCSDTSGSVEAVQLLELLNQARVDENLLFISYSQVSGSGKTHTFVKAHKKVYGEHETRVGMIALSTNTRLSDVWNKIMIYLKEAMFFYSSAFSTEEESIMCAKHFSHL